VVVAATLLGALESAPSRPFGLGRMAPGRLPVVASRQLEPGDAVLF
jgi:hypothetical protein